MPPRKKQHKTEAQKQRAFAERQKEAGRKRLCVWLSEDAISALKDKAAAKGQTQGEVLERLLMGRK